MTLINRVAVPVTFHRKFPFKSEMREVIKKINAEFDQITIVEILFKDHLDFNPFENGVMFVADTSDCFWTCGKVPGFTGSSRKTLSDYGARLGWQLASISSACNVSRNLFNSVLLYVFGVDNESEHSVLQTFDNRLTTRTGKNFHLFIFDPIKNHR